ncbi:MAG TPA: hypothetical protein VFX98_10080 [Longimicrobiaceae bacterium]|nr:hypothetical protein [Longimicrobiaceae bacterium]
MARIMAAALLLAAACGDGGVRASVAAEPAAPVDTVRAMDEELRRFTRGLAEPAALDGGEASLEALARRFVAAVAARDTQALRRMHLDRAEFAFLYYPSAPVSRPPYELPPGLLWFQVEGITNQGITRLLRELGGRALRFAALSCAAPPERQGPNLVHAGCRVEYADAGGERRAEKLFGNVLERGGRFKFISYANDYD